MDPYNPFEKINLIDSENVRQFLNEYLQLVRRYGMFVGSVDQTYLCDLRDQENAETFMDNFFSMIEEQICFESEEVKSGLKKRKEEKLSSEKVG